MSRGAALGCWLAALLLGGAGLAAQEAADPGGLSREEKESFLLDAEILDMEDLAIGVTHSRRATLSDDRLTHDAHVQTVDIYQQMFKAGRATEVNFRDFWGYNVAAYRLDKLLDLGIVPVSVEREVEGEEASVTWWVDRAMMSAKEYREGKHPAPDPVALERQIRQAWAFHQLVLNRDPNLGNAVIDEDWKIWLIDFTRAFRVWKRLDDVEPLTQIPRRFYDGLRRLDRRDVERELNPYLTKGAIKGLLARRDLLLEHYDGLIAKRGEAAVLVD
jgi:hypothetical protein